MNFKSIVNLGQLIGLASTMFLAILGLGAFQGATNEKLETIKKQADRLESIVQKQTEIIHKQQVSQEFILMMIDEQKQTNKDLLLQIEKSKK